MSDQALTPRLLEGATYTTAQRRHLFDVGFLISIMVMMLAVIPSPLAVPALSDLGHPATLMSFLLFGAWTLSRMHARFVTRGLQPMRWIMLFYFTGMLASYAAGLMRGMPSLEDNGAVRAIIATVGFMGVILCMADGVHSLSRLDGIVRVMLLGGAIMAVIGILQAMLALDITQYIQVPGLAYHGRLNGLEERGAGLFRVASTTGHYIEFSTVMAMLLPYAVHMGRFAPTRPMRQWAAVGGALMFLAVPMTMSRTGIVALAMALIVMVPAWSWRMRLNIVAPTLVLLTSLIFTMPGLLGTLLGLFQGWDNDPSVQGRAEDWDLIMEKHWLDGHWILGRGQGTFIPTEYTWLDNQWLQNLIGGGIVGVFLLALMHLGAITLAGIAYRRSQGATRHLAACLISTQMIGVAVGFTFDSMGFRTYAFFLAILTGAAACLWRLTAPPTGPLPED
jgi:O-Antigen ligase